MLICLCFVFVVVSFVYLICVIQMFFALFCFVFLNWTKIFSYCRLIDQANNVCPNEHMPVPIHLAHL